MQPFFDESTEQSRVKAQIVSAYFSVWAKVIMSTAKKNKGARYRNERLAYVDLFAGRGRYEDGTKSTPLMVLETAIADDNLREMLVTLFNDVDADSTQSLETAISELPGIESLHHAPCVYNEEVGTEIVKMFESMSLVPTLFFVDPWGYKGLSLRLINSVLKHWGSDCIFFFNYNRINMGLLNPAVREHMDSLFGVQRANRIREKLKGLSPEDRELTIIEELSQALMDMGGKYVLPFTFLNDSGSRTSHHLVFVSKHVRGYEIMKEVMAKQSSTADQGVPSFAYCPADSRYRLLFELTLPLDDLVEILLDEFAGQTLTMQDVYERHHVGRRFIKKNYKDALRLLEEKGGISADPPALRRRKNTFGDSVQVRFSSR
jgi:three-Cys-motif partner protein